jgi:hypothetical protein
MPDKGVEKVLWWMIQTPMIGLVAVGLWLLVGRVVGADGRFAVALAWLSRAATLVFLIYYTALDSIGGTGLGRLLLNTQCLASQYIAQCSPNKAAGLPLTPQQVDGIARLLDANCRDSWVGGVGSFISLTGSYAVQAASVFAALALALARKAGWPALLLFAGVRLATANKSRQPERPHRVRSPDPLGAVDLVVRAPRLSYGRSIGVASAIGRRTMNASCRTAKTAKASLKHHEGERHAGLFG